MLEHYMFHQLRTNSSFYFTILLRVCILPFAEEPILFVKLFCNTGLRIRELPNVTVEAVKAGEMTTGSKKSPTRFLFPSALRAELLDYASSAGIRGGSLFVRRNGNPLNHSEILPMIVKLFKKADVPRNKATSKVLRQFYRATRERIHSEIAAQVEGTL